MKRLFFLINLVLSVVVVNAQQVVTTSNVNLRSGPDIESSIVYKIHKGASVNLKGCQSDWCEINVDGHFGYIARQFTTSSGNHYSNSKIRTPHATGPINHYTNSRGNVVQSPTHYDSPPQGATAQCRDGSYSFSQSRRGTCSHHGGVARWLK